MIEFSDNLITGNEMIDQQHKELIERISKFVDVCENGDGKVKAIQMLDYMAEYTTFHFQQEEELQEKVSYPGLEEHRKKHEEFKKTVDVLYEFLDESEGPTEAFVQQVQKNVVNWLYQHIEGFDRSVAEYIKYEKRLGE